MNKKADSSSWSRPKKIGLFTGPALFALFMLFGNPGPATAMAASTLWIACWWIFESIPIPATSLLPLVLFPLAGIMPAKAVAPHYMNSHIFLFMGGFILALAIERWNLHRRIALNVISLVGDRPRRIVFGFMAATAFLSMWISNTATAMLMLPIALSVTKQTARAEAGPDKEKKRGGRFGLALMLGIAYSASIGGIGTLVGTPPNIVFSRVFTQTFPDGPEISFARWCLVGIPFAAVFLVIAWAFLVFVACPLRKTGEKNDTVREELRKLGPMSPPEKRVLFVFAATALLWFLRRDIELGAFVLPGWSSLLGLESLVDDGTVAISMALLLFLLPAGKENKRLMNWETAVRLPWGILLLFGGGFAIAAGMQDSGLSEWLSSHFHLLKGAPEWILILAVSLLLTFLTEITSNTATTNMILPILAAVAVTLEVDPLLIMIPATISASCAFMLPVATPPNAIVFGSGLVPIRTMARFGIAMNLIGAVLVLLTVKVLAKSVFGIG